MQGDKLEALCERVFLAAHSDGWRGNQLRRDVQHVDARKSWEAYVQDGALAKSIEAAALASPPVSDGGVRKLHVMYESDTAEPWMAKYPTSGGGEFVMVPREVVIAAIRDRRDNGGGSASYRQACNHLIEAVSLLRASPSRPSPSPELESAFRQGYAIGYHDGMDGDMNPDTAAARFLSALCDRGE